MIRRQVYLTALEIKDLNTSSKDLGISASEYLRRIVDDHFSKKKTGIFKDDPKFSSGKKRNSSVKK